MGVSSGGGVSSSRGVIGRKKRLERERAERAAIPDNIETVIIATAAAVELPSGE